MSELRMNDVKTGEEWDIDFIWFAFPGLKTYGYRVEGFHKTGMIDDYPEGEHREFGSLILEDGKLKIIN